MQPVRRLKKWDTVPTQWFSRRSVLSILASIITVTAFSQSHLIPVDAPANKYPITFTDIAQNTLVLEFTASVTSAGTATGWTITVGGSPVPMVGSPTGAGNFLRITLSSSIAYANRNTVIVSYAGTGGLTLTGGLSPVISNVQARNNYIAVAADFTNGLYGENPPIDICAQVINVEIEYNITLSQRYRNSIHYSLPIAWFQWQYPAVTPVTYPPFTEVGGAGTGVYRVVQNYPSYPDNTLNCTWDISVFPHLYNTGTLQPNLNVTQRRVVITIPNYKKDNGTPVPGTGDLGIDPPIDDPSTLFCVGDNITAFTFEDATVFDCQGAAAPLLPNLNPRYVQYVYGTQAGNGIPNVFIDVFGTMVQVTDNNGVVIKGPFNVDAYGNPAAPYTTLFGFEGPVVQYLWDPGSQALLTPLAVTYPIHHTGDFVNDVAGDIFDITLRNWGPCNPYDGGDPFTYLAAVTDISRLRLIASPPLPTAPSRTICFGETTTLTAVRNGAPNPGELYWYSNAALTTQVGTGLTYTPPVTAANSYNYWVREIAGTTGSCPGPARLVVLTIREEIQRPASITGSLNVCTSAAGLVFSAPSDPPNNPIGGQTEYVWSVPADWTIVSGQGTKDLTVNVGTTTGARTVSARTRYLTAPDCQTNLRSITVNVFAQPVAPGLTKSPNLATVCLGETLTVTTTAGSGGTGTVTDEYRFSTNNGGAWSAWSTTVPSFASVVGTNLVQSRRTATGPGCNTSPINEVSWTVIPDPIAPVIAKNPNVAEVCAGATLTITVTTAGSGGTGTNTDQYRHSTDNGANWSAWGTGLPSFAAVTGTNMVQSRRLSTGSSCNSNINEVSWTVVPDPVAPVMAKVPNVATVCAGANLTISVTPGSGGTGTSTDEYQFTINGGTTWSAWSTTIPNLTAVTGTTMISSRRASTGAGCGSNINTVSWTVVADPIAPVIAKSPDVATVCEGASLTITVTTAGSGGTGTNTNQYRFSTDNGVTWSAWDTPLPVFAAVVGTNLVQSRRLSTGTDCVSNINEVSWTVIPDPVAPVIAKNPADGIVCAGATLTITIATAGSGGTGTNTDEYRHSTNNGVAWSAWSTSIPNFTAVTGTNLVESRRSSTGSGCNSNVNQVSWTVVADPVAPVIAKDPNVVTVCSGTTLTITVTTPGSGGTGTNTDQYRHSTDNGTNWSAWGTTLPSFAAVVGTNLVESRRLSTGLHCVSNVNQLSWTVVPQPVAPGITKVPNLAQVCEGVTLTVSTTPGSGGTGTVADEYRYSTDNGITWSVWGTSVPSFAAVIGTNRIESRRTATGTGCNTSPSNSVSWTVNANPTPVISGLNNVCANVAGVLYSTPIAGGRTYVWTVSGGSITAGPGTNQITVTWGVAGSGWVRLTETIVASGCAITTADYDVTINPGAPATAPVFGTGATEICREGTLNINVSDVATAAEYVWDYSWVGVAGSEDASTVLSQASISLAGLIPGTYTVSVAAKNGCGRGPWMPVHTFDINDIPDLELLSNTVCSDGASGIILSITNFNATYCSGITYNITSINNGGLSIFAGAPSTGTGFAANEIANDAWINTTGNDVNVVYTVVPVSSQGCSGAPETVTLTVKPKPVVTTGLTEVICNGGTSNRSITTTNTPALAGVTYTWLAPVMTGGMTGGTARSIGSGLPITDTFVNNGTAPQTATYTLTPVYNGCTGPVQTIVITVNPTAQVNDPADMVLCNNGASGLITFTTNRTVGTTTYAWTNNNTSIGLGASGSGNIASFTATNAGTSPISATITVIPTFANGSVNCVGPAETFTITVNPTAQVDDPANMVLCNTSASGLITFTTNRTVGTTTYAWSNNNTAIGLGASGSGNIASFTATNAGTAPISATITVIPTFANGSVNCVGPAETFTITVNPTAQVNDPVNMVLCNNGASGLITFTTNRTVGTTTYAWSNDNTAIGLGASGSGNIASFTATNAGTSPISATITVIPTFANGSVNCVGPAETFTITVNPTAQVTDPADMVLCNTLASGIITFGTNRTGGTTSYAWSNSNTAIGLAASGSGNIASFTATNAGTAPISATITVIPTFANGSVNCVGPAETFTITVNPSAQVTDPANMVLCNNGASGAINFTTNRTGGTTTYAWSNNNTAIGLGVSGTGDIASFTATNAGTSPISATITVTPTYANGSVSCAGTAETFTITVNPTAQVNDPADMVLCNNGASGAIAFTTTRSGGTTTYAWTNSNTAIGLGASGTGTISSFTATNTGTAPISATITVTPTFANGSVNCVGPAETFTITVNPTAQVNDPANMVLCNNGASGLITFTTDRTVGTTTYAWANNNTAIGLGASGSGNIASFTATNAGTSPISATITVTPTIANGSVNCVGPAETFTITVNPTAQVIDPTDLVLCNTSGSGLITFATNRTGGTTTYAWANNNTAIGLGASGSGNIASFTATNAGTSPISATITVIPTFANGSVNCVGPAETFTITVNPTAQINDLTNQTLCSGNATTLVTFGTDRTGGTTTYSWTNSNTAIGLAASGTTSSIASFTALNPGNTAITATIAVTPTFTNGGTSCAGPSKNFTITVNPTPAVTNITTSVCSATAFSVTPVNSTNGIVPAGTTYSWGAPTGAGFTGGLAGSGVTIGGTLTNTTSAAVTATYTVTPTSSVALGSCVGSTFTVTVTVNPRPAITAMTGLTCSGTGFTVTPIDATNGLVPVGTTYSWGLPVVTGGLTGGATGSGAGNITGTLVNPTTTAQTATYTVTPISSVALGSCVGTPFDVVVTIDAKPAVTNMTGAACSGSAFSIAPVNGTNGIVPPGTTYSWGLPVVTGGVTGGATGTGAASITGTLSNPTNVAQTATYTVTPSIGSCPGASFTLTVTINPTPAVTNMVSTICSEGSFTVIPSNVTNGIVPAGTDYSWGAPLVTGGITGGAGGSGTGITGTLVNPTHEVQTATYTVTPTSSVALGSCVGATFTVTVTVNPRPTITPITATTCSEAGFSVSPANGTDGVVPAGTTYSWAAPGVTGGVTGGAGGSGAAVISGTLTNPTNIPQTATYTVTPLSGSCSGTPFTVTVTVNPKPAITLMTAAVCSQAPFTITPANGANGLVPAGTLYSWSAPSVTGGMTGGAAGTGEASINGTLVNNTGLAQTATYTVTPISGTCTGTDFFVIVTVNPLPAVSAITGDLNLCTTSSNKVYQVVNHSGSSYTWSVPGAILTKSFDSNIYFILVNATGATGSGVIEVTETISATGCSATAVPFNVTVSPVAPGVPVIGTTSVCQGQAGVTYSVPFNTGSTYSWSVPPGAIITSVPTLHEIVVTFSSFSGSVSVVETSGGVCNTIHTPLAVTVNPLPTIFNLTSPPAYCAGDPGVVITLSGSEVGVNYQLNNSVGIVGGAEPGTGAPLTWPNNLAESYYVVATNALTSCTRPMNGTVVPTINMVDGGVIAADQAICENTSPLPFTSPTPGTGGGSITYQWQSSIDNVTFTNIPGATSALFTANLLTVDTWFKRIAFSTIGISVCSDESNVVLVKVINFVPGSITNAQTICEGATPATLGSVTPTGDGLFSYQWRNSTDGVTFSDILGATLETFDPPALLVDTWYKRVVKSTLDGRECTQETNIIKITVINFTPGVIGIDQTICENTAPATFTGTAAIGDGTKAYQWQISTDGIGWADILVNGTNPTYTSPALTVDTWFRRAATATDNAVSCTEFSNEVKVTINAFDPGTITADQTICEGEIPAAFGGSAPTGVAGAVYTYQWQSSIDGVTYSNIPGATTITFASGALMADTWFTRRVTSTLNGNACTEFTPAIKVTVNNFLPGSITGTQTICEGEVPAAFTQTAPSGDGTFTYQWQFSTTSDTGPWSNILVDGTNATYAPLALTQDTWYKRIVFSDHLGQICSKETNVLRVTVNNFDPGSIAGDQVICESTPAAPLTSVTPTGDGVFTYRWFVSTDGAIFALIPGALSETYSPGILTADRWYQREVISTLNGKACAELTNIVYVQVNNMAPGAITGEQTICDGATPVVFGSAAATGDGGITYQWQESINGIAFTNILGATLDIYAPGALTADTWYKRLATSTIGANECTEESNIIRVTVINFIAGSIGSDQTICEGTAPAPFTSVAASGDGSKSYQWQSSLDGTSWNDILVNGNNPTYTSPALTQDTHFRRVVTSTMNLTACVQITNEILVTVNNFVPGSITGDETICEGGTPAPFGSVAASGDGIFTYQWQFSLDGTSFSNITGATSDLYTSGALTVDTWFRRVVTSTLNSVQCVEITNNIKVTVNNFLPGSITGTQTICEGEVPAAFTQAAPSGDGTFTYQWQFSTTSDTGPWSNILVDGTNATYAPLALTQDTWYKRIVFSDHLGQICSDETNVLRVTVNNFDPGSIAGDQVICESTPAAPLTSVTPTGDGVFTYRWFVSTDGAIFALIPGALSETYSPGILTADRWYQREVISTLNGKACAELTNIVYVQVNNMAPGAITGEQTICDGATPVVFGSAAATGDGGITYQWQESINGIAFTNILGATLDIYAPGALTADRWYKRLATSTIGLNECTRESNVVRVTVINFLPGSVGGEQTICEGTAPTPFTSVAPSGDGSFTYQWQSSPDGTTWSDILVNGNNPTYTSPALTQDTYFRREVTATVNLTGCEQYTNVILVTVNNFDPGSISIDETICEGGIPAAFGSTAPTGDGTFTYQWQSSTDGVSYMNITGATAETYTSIPLMQDTWFRRLVTSTLNGMTCSELTTAIKITVNNFTPGSITGTQTICEGEVPVPFTQTAPAGDGTFTYQWQFSTTSDTGPWSNILVDGTNATYAPLALTQDTWYKRIVSSDLLGFICSEETNVIRVTVNNFEPGSIAGDQVICENTPAVTFTSVTATGDGAITYRWLISSDGLIFAAIPGAINEIYNPGILLADSWYKREVTSTLNGKSCIEETNVVYVQVNNMDPGAITGEQTICDGTTPVAFGSTAATGDGGISYQWQESINGIAFTNIAGETFAIYTPGVLTADRWYKRLATSTIGLNECTEESNIIRVTVINFTPGAINADQTICEGTAPATFNGSAPSGDGSFTYQWQQSLDGVSFSNILLANAPSYTHGALTVNTWFRRVVTSTLNLVQCSDITNAVMVTINSVTTGISTADQTICEGTAPAMFNSTPPTGSGVLTYQWQQSVDGVNYSNITGANAASYTSGALNVDTWFRLSVTSTLNGNQCSALTNAVAVTVVNFVPGSISANQTICENTAPAALTSVTPTGDGAFTYQWQDSPDGVTFTNILTATSETFAPPVLTADRWYKRVVTSTLNLVSCVKETNIIKITVNNFIPGSVAGSQTICEGTAPLPFTSVTPTGDGAFSYRWFESSNGVAFALIPGAITETYGPGVLMADRWYKREVTSTLNGNTCIAETNVIWIEVNNFLPGSITGVQTICEGTVPAALGSVTPTGDGTFTYQWRSSSDGVNFLDIPLATAETFAPPALTQDTWYKRTVISTLNGVPCTKETNAVKVTVNNVNPGTIIADQTICNGSAPVTFMNVVAGTGDGAVTYQWQSSSDGVSFANIGAATSMIYTSPALIADTWFRRVTSSVLDGVTCTAVSNIIKVTVNEAFGGTIAADQTICYGTVPAALTSTDNGSGTGLVTYQWMRSNNNVIYNTIPGETGTTYTPGALVTETYFKRVLTSVLNGVVCTAESNAVRIQINPLPIAILTGGATICPTESAILSINLPVGQAPFEIEIENHPVLITGYNSDDPISVSPPMTTTYRLLRVTDANGCEILTGSPSLMGTALVTVRALPVITTPPSNITVCEYGIVTFNVTATGSDLTYQWYVRPPAGVFAPVVDGGVYFGAESPSLMLFGPTRLMDGYEFRAEVMGCGATEVSGTALLTVNQVPEIVAQPQDTTVCMDAGAGFTVNATGTGLVYQWQVRVGPSFVDVINDGNYSGATTSTLTIGSVPGTWNNNVYRVRISGVCGAPVFSNFVFLRVNLPPTITINPANREVCEDGGPVYFVANGSGVIDSIRWQVSTDGGGTWNDLFDNAIYSGTTSQQLALVGIPVGYNGYRYRLGLKAVCTTSYSNSATLTVNPAPVVDFTAIDPIDLCGGVSLMLNGSPAGGTAPYTQHRWGGDIGPLNSFTSQTPTFRTSIQNDYTLYYTVTDSKGCKGSDTLVVRVERPVAMFMPSTNAGCTDLAVTFTNSSTGYASLLWTFGDGNTSTAENPVHTYVNATTNLMYYNAKLRVTSASGCVDSMMMGITVYPQTESSFTLSSDTICSGDMVTFVAQPGGFQYYWVYGDGQEQYGLNVNNHTFINGAATPVTYNVKLTTTSFFGCTSETIQPVVVYPMPVAEFTASPPTQVFPNRTVSFTNLTNPGTFTYLWRFGDGNTSTTFQPTHIYAAPGDYNVTLIASNGRCTDSVFHLVRILPIPPVASFDEVLSGCMPWTVTLTNTSLYGTSYHWDFGDGAISTSANPTYTYYNSGTYRITLTVTGPGGVSVTDRLLTVYQTPRAYFEFAPEKVFVNDERVRFFNLSQWATSYIWDFADGDTSHVKDPFHKYLVKGVFDVTLHAYSAEGCYDSYTATPGVLVEPAGEIRFATAFLPNKDGPSGNIDITTIGSANIDKFFFPPITDQIDPDTYKLQIFNRWGVLIYESRNINTGWDGYYKGKLVKQGVYVWIVEGKYANGKPFRKSGDVTLLH